MHLMAAAEMTPSGVPPIPISRSTPVNGCEAAIDGATSPSRIRFTRAPDSRSSAISASWRSRSRTTTVTSVTSSPFAFATARTFSVGVALMSIASAASGPTAILSMYSAAPGKNIVPSSETAITAIAFGWPSAVSRVPSSGSTATSTAGPLPSPTSSPLKSIGASSFSPSPITTLPRIRTVSRISRIASTAAASALSFCPRPTQPDAASAAASVTRTRSRARLRSGAVALTPANPMPLPPGTRTRAQRTLQRRDYIVSGASTPIRSRLRAITDRAAVQRPRRKASVSDPSTLWWW